MYFFFLLDKYLLNVYHVPGIAQGSVKMVDKSLSFWSLSIICHVEYPQRKGYGSHPQGTWSTEDL
jgi:hypothetical protein